MATLAMEFTLFPKLAHELRDMIWTFALPAPRTITITFARIVTPNLNRTDDWYTYGADAGPIATTLLHACSRSRNLSLSRYEPCFESQFRAPFYFDSQNDTLRFPDTRSACHFIKGQTGTPVGVELRAKVRHFEIAHCTRREEPALIFRLGLLDSLETVAIELRKEWQESPEDSQARQEQLQSYILERWMNRHGSGGVAEKGVNHKPPSIRFINV